MKYYFSKFLLFVFLIALSSRCYAQIGSGGTPWSFSNDGISNAYQHISVAFAPQEEDVEALDSEMYKPNHFARLIPLDIRPNESGTLELLDNGGSIWRLKLSAEGNQATSLYFQDFKLPQGVRLYVYSGVLKELKGAFTSKNNSPSGLFATSLIFSQEVILELNIPRGMDLGPWFTVSELSFSPLALFDFQGTKGFGTSDFCEVNINCSPEGDAWQDQKRGVARIQVKANGNLYWCTGTMVNNTSYDNTPYLLTADHCAFKSGGYASVDDLENWIFYFNYESLNCENPAQEPDLYSIKGCEKIAHGGFRGLTGSDFFLVKLNEDIPNEWNVYFNGWSAVDQTSGYGVTIHHPDGDIKKISTYDDELTTVGWSGNGLPSHWRVVWVETENNHGVTEGGSSGAPIYDEEGRLIGTLTGGLASCWAQSDPDYYGKFSYHWESNGSHDTTQLKPWLDPGNSGVLVMDGATLGVRPSKAHTNGPAFSLHPNPVDDHLNLVLQSPVQKTYTLEIVDLMGKTAYYDEFDANSAPLNIKVKQLKAGIYFLRLDAAATGGVQKFIKR